MICKHGIDEMYCAYCKEYEKKMAEALRKHSIESLQPNINDVLDGECYAEDVHYNNS